MRILSVFSEMLGEWLNEGESRPQWYFVSTSVVVRHHRARVVMRPRWRYDTKAFLLCLDRGGL